MIDPTQLEIGDEISPQDIGLPSLFLPPNYHLKVEGITRKLTTDKEYVIDAILLMLTRERDF